MENNEKLYDLYKNVDIINKMWKYADESKNNDWAYPLLIKSNMEYENSDIKIMIFGKETNGWGDPDVSDDDTDENVLMEYYETFFNKGNCTYGGQFWNLFKIIMKMLRNEINNKSISFIWNNIIKVGKNGKGYPHKLYDNIIKNNFEKVIIEEINILKPDFFIFFTGSNSSNGPYDYVLNNVFNNPDRIKINDFNISELCEVSIPNIKKAFRTYHPTFLIFNNKNRDYKEYFKKIINAIKYSL